MKEKKNKNVELAKYLLEHKDLRVWQNIRNWSDYQVIYGSHDTNLMGGDLVDTFYQE